MEEVQGKSETPYLDIHWNLPLVKYQILQSYFLTTTSDQLSSLVPWTPHCSSYYFPPRHHFLFYSVWITWFYHFNTLLPSLYFHFPVFVQPGHPTLPNLHWSYSAREAPKTIQKTQLYFTISVGPPCHTSPQLWSIPTFITHLYNFTNLSPPPLLMGSPSLAALDPR